MWSKIATFWSVFVQSMRAAYSAIRPKPRKSQKWQDITKPNFLEIFVNTLSNLCNIEATFDVEYDNISAEPLKDLCEDMQSKRYEITAMALATGDCFCFPYTNAKGEMRHSYMPQDMVSIVAVDGEKITEAYGIIDWYVDNKNNFYYLMRHHLLDDNGTLFISYDVFDANAKKASVEKWEFLKGETVTIPEAYHIGFGRYKCPTNSRCLENVYGVPLNFGCESIEKEIFEDLKLIHDEFENGKSLIFTDPRNIIKDSERKKYVLAENIFPIQQRDNQNGSNVDIFNPDLRFAPHYSKYVADCALLEKQIGTSKGILTENETAYTATATAVKRSNTDTIALIGKIREMLDNGNRETLEADAMYLSIGAEWSYFSDWYDPFEDAAEQWQRLRDGKADGAVETTDQIRWLFPQMTDEQIERKILRIKQENKANSELALERILG